MLVMVLTEQGILDLDENVNKQLLSWKVPNNKVSLRSLLAHQSGVIDPEDSFSELHLKDPVPSLVELLEGKSPYCKTTVEVTSEPWSEFHYSDAGYCIIQQLIEDVTGKPFETVARELIFHPLQMKYSSFPKNISDVTKTSLSCGHNKKGQLIEEIYSIYPYQAASGLWTTPTDLARLVIELINSLKGQSKIGLSKMKANEILNHTGVKNGLD
jgi:CubicO group peptidase (beta-lactamase class C family)